MPGPRCVQVLAANHRSDAVEHILDVTGHGRLTCQAAKAAGALLRPDSCIAALGKQIDAALVQAVDTALGVQRSRNRSISNLIFGMLTRFTSTC